MNNEYLIRIRDLITVKIDVDDLKDHGIVIGIEDINKICDDHGVVHFTDLEDYKVQVTQLLETTADWIRVGEVKAFPTGTDIWN